MPNYAGGVNVLCPFYVREADKSISCEGFYDNNTLMTKFPSKDSKREFMARKCENAYQSCMLARALIRKYEGELRYEEDCRRKKADANGRG